MHALVFFAVAAQSLPRELSLSASGRLLQSWVPELQAMRDWSPEHHALQLEVAAQFTISSNLDVATLPRFGFTVLGVSGTDEATEIGVDLGLEIVFIDGRKSNSCAAVPWQCPYQPPHPAPPSARAAGLYPAGPLLGSRTSINVHCYVDAVYVACIFNNQTAITAMVAPSARATAPVASFGTLEGVVTSIQSWRLALPGAH